MMRSKLVYVIMFSVYSAHNFAPCHSSWPAFTASITFELFKKREEASPRSYLQTMLGGFMSFGKSRIRSEHCAFVCPAKTLISHLLTYANVFEDVRMRYQNKDMTLPLCASGGKHLAGSPEFCTLKAFQERIKELTPEDWDLECSPSGRR